MLAHLQLMEKFLETQEAVMRQFLAGSALTAGDTKRPIAQASPASAHTAPMAGPPPKEPVISPSTQVTQESLAADLAVKASEDSVAPARPELDQKVSSRHEALDVKAVLLRLVSEKTGYPEEVLDLEANLEADLGIDSIKRVEILSTFGRETGLLNLKDMDRVSSLKTLGEMIGFFVQRSAAGHKVESKGEGLAPTQPTATFPRPTEEEGKGLPFIREVRVHIPGQELEAWCTLSLDEDRFLHDHTLGREISQLDASLLALPVVPLTMSMEILAEAAAYLMPGQALIGMRHVRAYRWILLENESIPLVVVARRKPASNEVEVRLQEADSEGVVQPTPILEGTMVFASARPAPEPAPPFHAARGAPFPLAAVPALHQRNVPWAGFPSGGFDRSVGRGWGCRHPAGSLLRPIPAVPSGPGLHRRAGDPGCGGPVDRLLDDGAPGDGICGLPISAGGTRFLWTASDPIRRGELPGP
jgi:acyl carrier protein